MNRICNTCIIEKDENNFSKDRTACKNCYNKNRRKNNNNTLIQYQQQKVYSNINNVNNPNVSAYRIHAYVVIGPRNVSKTDYMLRMLEKIGSKRSIHIITRSPNQYSIYKTSNEIKTISIYKGSVVILDDMLGARNSSQIGEF